MEYLINFIIGVAVALTATFLTYCCSERFRGAWREFWATHPVLKNSGIGAAGVGVCLVAVFVLQSFNQLGFRGTDEVAVNEKRMPEAADNHKQRSFPQEHEDAAGSPSENKTFHDVFKPELVLENDATDAYTYVIPQEDGSQVLKRVPHAILKLIRLHGLDPVVLPAGYEWHSESIQATHAHYGEDVYSIYPGLDYCYVCNQFYSLENGDTVVWTAKKSEIIPLAPTE